MSFRTKALGIAAAATVMAAPVVMHFEGRSLIAYLDPVGIPTICDGITASVKMGDIATHKECDDKLKVELFKADNAILLNVHPDVLFSMPVHRRAALISFIYNVGPTAFERSTLLKKLNAGDWYGACNELPKWVYAKGKKLRGLERRREAERKLCLSGSSSSYSL